MHVVDIARSHGMYLVWGEQTETIYEKTCDDPYIVTILQVANHFFIHILRQFFWAQRWRPPYHWWNQKRVYSPFKSMPQISILGKLDDISVISAFERKHMFFLFFDVYIRIYIYDTINNMYFQVKLSLSPSIFAPGRARSACREFSITAAMGDLWIDDILMSMIWIYMYTWDYWVIWISSYPIHFLYMAMDIWYINAC